MVLFGMTFVVCRGVLCMGLRLLGTGGCVTTCSTQMILVVNIVVQIRIKVISDMFIVGVVTGDMSLVACRSLQTAQGRCLVLAAI